MRKLPRMIAVLAAAVVLVPAAAASAAATPRTVSGQTSPAVHGQTNPSNESTGAGGVSAEPGMDTRSMARHHGTRHHGRHHWCAKHRHTHGPASCGRHRHKGGPGGPSLGSSTGIHLYNNSVDKLVLTAVSGSSEGVPPIGSVLSSGVGSQDFEVTFRAFKSTTVTATYDVYDLTNTKIGRATIFLSNDAVGDTSVSGGFVASPNWLQPLPLMTAKYGSDFQVQGSSSAPITIDASSPAAVAMLNDYCNTTNTHATCTYTPSSRTAGTQMHLLAEGYTIPGGGNTTGTVSVSSGYSASTATSWSVTVTAQTEMADILEAGISATYGQTVTWTNTFTAGASIPVDPGYTGYIWGNSPVINYSGTMQIKLGSTTYNIVNAGLATPDPSRALSDFNWGTYLGNDPLHSPDKPPASAVPLP
jgi:hypothetical protein